MCMGTQCNNEVGEMDVLGFITTSHFIMQVSLSQVVWCGVYLQTIYCAGFSVFKLDYLNNALNFALSIVHFCYKIYTNSI